MFEIAAAKAGYLITIDGKVFGRFPDLENCLKALGRLERWFYHHQDLPPAFRIEAAVKESIFHDKVTGEFGYEFEGWWIGLKVDEGKVRLVVRDEYELEGQWVEWR